MRYATFVAAVLGSFLAATCFAQRPPDSVTSVSNNNTAAGASTLISNSTRYSNTAIGSNAMVFNGSGYENTAVGNGPMRAQLGNLRGADRRVPSQER